MTRLIRTLLLIGTFLLFIGLSTATAARTAGLTFTVDSADDEGDAVAGDGQCKSKSGACTLRAAIEELNGQGAPTSGNHRIEFNISGAGPHTIFPQSELPGIVSRVVIDGTTQPGSSCPTPNAPAKLMIVLNGSAAGPGSDGLQLRYPTFASDSGRDAVWSDGSTIRGLVIGNFGGSGIYLYSRNNRIICNHIGISPDGKTVLGNGVHGIYVVGNNAVIGGLKADQRNVISGNNANGVHIFHNSASSLVAANFIGTTADGMGAAGNGTGGLFIGGSNHRVGRSGAAFNLISGNTGYGIRIDGGDDNIVQRNFIGLARDAATSLPNGGSGVEILGLATANVIGFSPLGFDGPNLIAHNLGGGIVLGEGDGGDPINDSILRNAIFDNGQLGIDLGQDGVDSNDGPGDGDGGSNLGQNYPLLESTPGSYFVSGMLESQSNTLYAITYYRNVSCDPSGYGEGQDFLGEVNATTNGAGEASFTLNLTGLVSTGSGITATATDPDGNTSEFSKCVLMSGIATATPTATATALPTNTAIPTSTATTAPSSTPTATLEPGALPYEIGLPIILKD